MRPKIGITVGRVTDQKFPNAPEVYGQSHTYSDAILRAGGLPLLIPMSEKPEVFDQLADELDGLLLAGGNDLNPTHYGEFTRETTVDVDDIRDKQEFYLLDRFASSGKPILAICRGMQLVNVHFGGTLHQHIPRDIDSNIDHNLNTTKTKDAAALAHSIEILPSSKLAKILGTTAIKTNSCHHQAVKKLGAGLEVTAWTKDEVVEAIENRNYPYLVGVQAHPESLEGAAVPLWQTLFSSFVHASVRKAVTKPRLAA